MKHKKVMVGSAPKALPDDMLEIISGGKQNLDSNGNWDTNTDHLTQWRKDLYNKKSYMKCPSCGEYMFNNMNRYDDNMWQQCFWYNRLYCYKCRNWTEELN